MQITIETLKAELDIFPNRILLILACISNNKLIIKRIVFNGNRIFLALSTGIAYDEISSHHAAAGEYALVLIIRCIYATNI